MRKLESWEKFRLHLERDGNVSLGEDECKYGFMLSNVVEYV